MKKKKRQKPDGAEAAEPQTDLLATLGDDNAGDFSELKISETFARKYNAKKDKAELAHANRVLRDEDNGSESAEEEDEDGELLTAKVDNKIFDTMARIKSKDPSIYDSKHTFFEDEDFAEPTASSSAGSEKKVRYKDFLRSTLLKEGADAMAKEEEALDAKERAAKAKRKKKGLTPMEEQAALKADIIAAAADDGGDDGLFSFSLKQKGTEELAKEDEEFRDFNLRKDKEPKGRHAEEADDIVARYWKADEDLDEGEQFLRDYLLNKGWQEVSSLQAAPGQVDINALPSRRNLEEEEDEKGDMDGSGSEEDHLADVDEFEKEYNFRFEVEEGRQITGHARTQDQSVRERPDKRKRQRAEKAERKGADKVRRTEELKRLKNLKKEEIKRRLQQLKDITGNEDTALGAVDLDADFDPDAHDKDVAKLLGDEFDDQEEPLAGSELVQAPTGHEKELDVSGAADEVMDRRRRKKGDLGATGRGGGGDDEAEDEGDSGIVEGTRGDDSEPGLWFLCDACQKGIPPGKKRFDCTVREDYTLCAKCFRVRRDPHKFVRKKVPEKCKPPEDWKGKEAPSQDVENVLDEYFQLDYEDIIGGDLPTRFKYRKVEGKDYGMTGAEILAKSDQELNRIVPLKKLRTYRDDPAGGGGAHDHDPRWQKKRQDASSSSWSKPRPWKQAASSDISAGRLSAYSLGLVDDSGGRKKHRKA